MPQMETASMLTKLLISSLLCHNDTIYKEWLKSKNYIKGEHTQIELIKACFFLKFF